MTFFNLPSGQYEISIATEKLTKPVRVSVVAGGNPPVVSDPIMPGPPRRDTAATKPPVKLVRREVPLTFTIVADETPGAVSHNSRRSNISQKSGLMPTRAPKNTAIEVTIMVDTTTR